MREHPTFREIFVEQLQDPEFAYEYIKLALEEYEEDKDMPFFLDTLRALTDAQGGISKLAAKTKLNRQHLYRILSPEGNPTLETIGVILRGLGFRFSVVPLEKKAKPTKRKKAVS